MPTSSKIPRLKNLVLRTIIVIITAILASLIPKFSLFINLIGSFSCTLLAFIMPCLMYNKCYELHISKLRKVFNISIAVFGTICGLISFVMSSIEIVNAFNMKIKYW